MLLSAVSVLVVAQSSSEIPEGLMNNPVYTRLQVVNHFFFKGKFLFHVSWMQAFRTYEIMYVVPERLYVRDKLRDWTPAPSMLKRNRFWTPRFAFRRL